MTGSTWTRREWLGAMGAAAAFASQTHARATAQTQKPLQGVFKILATPYKQDKSVDYEDLAAEVEFLVRCGVQGLVWPQNSSDLPYLVEEEILEGMEVIAKAARGTKPALVLGVQGRNTETMLRLAAHAERLGPDAMIAMPPKEAATLDEYREYFSELCRLTKRPVFIQTSAGAPDIEPAVDFIVEMGKKFPNFGYVKEEYGETIPRMVELAKHRPGPIKRIFGGSRALGWTYEMRLGMDGMMTGGPQYAEVYARIWQLHLENQLDAVRDLYSKLLLITNLESRVPGLRPYLMKQRGVFKTHVTRQGDFQFGPVAIAEIEYNLEPLKPYLNA
ncbi:MAG TPA: dihydrodipicolinate synthase family protein [Vicinamibacteria bacterium]|nr:dihydrodipicolinate synthase family protein [Vicinamibacteria bacterium]